MSFHDNIAGAVFGLNSISKSFFISWFFTSMSLPLTLSTNRKSASVMIDCCLLMIVWIVGLICISS